MKILMWSFMATLILILCAAIACGLTYAFIWIMPYVFYAFIETDNAILQAGSWVCLLWFSVAFLMIIEKLKNQQEAVKVSHETYQPLHGADREQA